MPRPFAEQRRLINRLLRKARRAMAGIMAPDDLHALIAAHCEERFIQSAGPGGQNVNKLATAVQLRLDVFALRLAPPVFARLKALAGSKMTNAGELVLTAREHRTQGANRDAARARLVALIEDAHRLPEKRAKSRLNRIGKEQRIAGKKLRGSVKAARGRVTRDD